MSSPRWAVLILCLPALAATPGRAQVAAPPVVVGPLVGPLATLPMPGLRVYGNDLGWTFEHRGEIVMLFGDTWPYARFLCDVAPTNDDTQATLPLVSPAGVPPITFVTRADAPDEAATMRLLRDGASLTLGFGETPTTGFSDGADAFGVFVRGEPIPCRRRSRRARPTCRPHRHLACTQDVGRCGPPVLGSSPGCHLATGAGCLPGQTCQPTPDGLCFDPTSSQHDGSAAGLLAALATDVAIGLQDPATPTDYRAVVSLATNKFINATSRTIAKLGARARDDDYGPGHDTLLVWGRPRWVAEQGRQAHLYLMVHRLPLRGRSGRVRFRPRFFAGLDRRGEPRWTRREARAAPLALDGVAGGSPTEVLSIVDQMAISWLPAPVGRWVMLYGGDLADYLLADPAGSRSVDAPGAIRIRFADHPWGPWTPPEPHLLPGDPLVPGDPYGPGGVLFHTQCADAGALRCAPTDPTRPPDAFLPGCPGFGATFDVGRFYAPNIIDAYTRADGAGGVDIVWNVSTWNPYGVVVLTSNIGPAQPAK